MAPWRAGGGLFWLAPPAGATVNTEDIRVEAPVSGFRGRLSLSVTGQSGNTDKSTTREALINVQIARPAQAAPCMFMDLWHPGLAPGQRIGT